jgi:hypothetical protein
MPMPPQLARADRRHSRHSEPRPTVELMPAICIHDLRHIIPRYRGQVIQPDVSLRYPGLAHLRLSASCLEVVGQNGYVQRFPIAWIRTGFGNHRPILVCSSCRVGAIRLFSKYGSYACRHCHRALYASQKYNQVGRKRLQASKLRLQLGGFPDIRDSIPAKPKWTRRRTYQRIRNEIQALEAKAKTRRFRTPLSTQLFAYHAS